MKTTPDFLREATSKAERINQKHGKLIFRIVDVPMSNIVIYASKIEPLDLIMNMQCNIFICYFRPMKSTLKPTLWQNKLWLPRFWTWFNRHLTTNSLERVQMKRQKRWTEARQNLLFYLLMRSRWKFFCIFLCYAKIKMFRMSS